MNAFEKYLNPKSIAIVGASRSKEKVGYQILKNLIEDGYRGKIYPINPNADTILKLKCYPTLSQAPKQIDMAVIIVPAPLVATIIAECAENHIENAIIISAGFSESGVKGALLQQELSHTLLKHHVNILGPNCLGVLSPIHHLNATFGPHLPKKGSIMLISQSGALVTGIIDWAEKMDIGLSHAITFGNRVGVGEIEALEFAASDPHTKAILVYLESFQNAPRFFAACSRLTPQKPIIFLKGGQSLAGQSASASHTASLASNYILTKALARQTGVILTETIQEWLNLAAAFTHVPVAKSTDLTIITNAGGPGVLSSDEATTFGLHLPEPTSTTKKKMNQLLPRVNPHNPLDILGDASPDDFGTTLKILKQDSTVSNQLIIITPQTTTKPLETAQKIIDAKSYLATPTYAVMIGGNKMKPARKLLGEHHILNFDFPTQALQIIAAKSTYEMDKASIPLFPSRRLRFVEPKTISALEKKLSSGLTAGTAFKLLAAYGFKLPKSAIINTTEEIGDALNFVGRPAVIKTAGMNIAHKAKVGGVQLDIMTAVAARLAYGKILTLYPEVLFQQTIKGELEIIIGAKRDASLGAFITVGLGGTLTNTLEDRAYAFIPTTASYLESTFKKTKAYQILVKKKLPLSPVIDAMMRLASVLQDFDCIDELEINPGILTTKTLYAADIKITLNSV